MSGSGTAAGRPNNIADIVRGAARQYPNNTAITSGDIHLTWGQLDAAIDGAQAMFADQLRPGHTVVLALPTSAELAVALFATLRAGAIAVPVDVERSNIAWVAERARARAVIGPNGINTGRIDSGEVSLIERGAISEVIAAALKTYDVSRGPQAVVATAGGEDTAMLARAARLGAPVMLSHRAIVAGAAAVSGSGQLQLTSNDRVLQILPLYHVVGLVTAFLPAAIAGASVVIPGPASAATRVAVALESIKAHRVSVLPAESTLYRQLHRIDGFERALATVRLMTSGSSPLDRHDFTALRTATGQAVREGYGISEAASVVTSTLRVAVARPGSVGLPYPQVELKIRRSGLSPEEQGNVIRETAHPVAGDETAADPATESITYGVTDVLSPEPGGGGVGRIMIRGEVLFSGYWPDGTGGPDDEGWFDTGDIGYLDDGGELHLVDRKSEMFTIAGFTVYPREVENVLVGHPYVADAAVVSVPGRGGPTVVAALVAKPDKHPTVGDLEDFVADKLAPFKRPTGYQLVEELPRTEVGRLDRRAVRVNYAAARGIDLGEEADPSRVVAQLPGPHSDMVTVRGADDTDDDLF